MKVALYVRRSTIDLQPDSLEAQEERLRSHAAASGHEAVWVRDFSCRSKTVLVTGVDRAIGPISLKGARRPQRRAPPECRCGGLST